MLFKLFQDDKARIKFVRTLAKLCQSLPGQVPLPEPNSAPIQELGRAQNAYLCCQLVQQQRRRSRSSSESNSIESSSESSSKSSSESSSCSYITTSHLRMQKHTNQQHSVKLSRWSTPSAASYAEHAAQLWRPVKVQTFFRERRYVRYFIVQEQE
jgi:hypothetical protein